MERGITGKKEYKKGDREVMKRLFSMGLVAVVGLGFATGALADDGDKSSEYDIQVEIKGGGLHIETPDVIDFGDITIKKDAETYFTNFDDTGDTDGKVRVKDLRGTLDGWNVKVNATQFENGDGDTLPVGSLEINGVTDISALEGDGTEGMPNAELSETTVLDDGDVLVANAEEGKGAGVYDIDFGEDALGLTVDATTAKVGQYESTLTWTLEASPVID